VAVAAASLFTIILFLVYNHLVEERQHKVLSQAAASTAIVSSLFPKEIQQRLMQRQEGQSKQKKTGLTTFLAGGERDSSDDRDAMADLFPSCTVMFADIAGFTAWSSTREPSQVFILLQTLFQCFDNLAKKRKVFKVETIGDCYVAVTGLPEAQPQHATIMARFTYQCKTKMTLLTRELELRLGPGTADLDLRM
jgi:class 3 adenylate cyclase